MNKELLVKLKHRKEKQKKQKQGQLNQCRGWVEDTETVSEHAGIELVRKVIAQQELSLVRDLKGIKEVSTNISAAKERLGEKESSAEWNMGKADLFHASFTLVFAGKICMQQSEASATREKTCSNQHLPSVEELLDMGNI